MALINEKKVMLNDIEVVIGSACVEDSDELIAYIKKIDSETDFLLRTPGEFNMTTEEERAYIANIRDSERDLLLTAKVDGKIVGTIGFAGQSYLKYKHKGEFGVSVLKDFWGFGIGRALIKVMMDWADETGIVRIILDVDATNKRAIRLYEGLGFIKEGVLKDDIRMADGSYRDSIIMARINMRNKNN